MKIKKSELFILSSDFSDFVYVYIKSFYHTTHTCKHTELGWFSKAKPFTNHDNIFTSICCHFFNLLFFICFYYILNFLSRFLLFLLLYSTFFQKFYFFFVFFNLFLKSKCGTKNENYQSLKNRTYF